jgi:hypothetical protein
MKQFKVPRQEHEGIPFELVYEKIIDGEWKEQSDKFTARGQVPGNLLVSLTAASNGSVGLQAAELQRMLGIAISADDKERFMEVLDDPDTAIPIETLGEIITWLAEEYGGRPTQSA